MARQLHCAIGLLCCIAPVFVCSSIDHFKLQAHELLLLLLLLCFLPCCSPIRQPTLIMRLPLPALSCAACLPAVRASMLMSAPEQPSMVAPDARDQQEGIRNKPRK